MAPEQQVIDPNAVIGSFGTKFERGLKAGWGDLVYGTGDTVDWISAWATPGEADPTTSIGSWLKDVGQEYKMIMFLFYLKTLKICAGMIYLKVNFGHLNFLNY